MDTLHKFIIQKNKSFTFGFAWNDPSAAIKQVVSECLEVQEVLDQKQGYKRLEEEIGDVIHAALSLCIESGLDPIATLEKSINKFDKRFASLIAEAKKNGFETLQGLPMSDKLALWKKAKATVEKRAIP